MMLRKNLVATAAALVVLYVLFGLLDFGLAVLKSNRCVTASERADMSEARQSVLSLIETGKPDDLHLAALSLYSEDLVADAQTPLGLRDLCLAEQIHRSAAEMGSAESLDWLKQFYSEVNFPMIGNGESYRNNCAAEAWNAWQMGQPIPSRPFSFTRYAYFWSSSCKMTYFGRSEADRVFLNGVRCALGKLS
ncbi:hypothetical protein ACMA5I_15625 [Paracoccaceae bacterium GXU_MW_L88]